MSLNKNTWKFLDLPKDRGKEKEREACGPIFFRPWTANHPAFRSQDCDASSQRRKEKKSLGNKPLLKPLLFVLLNFLLPNELVTVGT